MSLVPDGSLPLKPQQQALVQAILELALDHQHKTGQALSCIRPKYKKVGGIHKLDGFSLEWKYDDDKARAEGEELYYIQNSYVGNAISWWRIDGKGYTCDIRQAGRYTKEEATKIFNEKNSNVPWPCSYVNLHRTAMIDMQNLRVSENPFLQK